MKSTIKLILIFALFALFATQNSAFALSNDRDQAADIESDEVDVDFSTGKRTFIGNVRFVQGTLRVKANRIDATFKDGKLAKAIAYGEPAAFKQRPDGKKNDVEGKGKIIVMNQAANTLILKKQASLTQGFDQARGEHIFYNMATDKLKVKGSAKASASNNSAKKSSSNISKDDEFFSKQESNARKAISTSSSTNSDELPKELILPGQSKAKKTESNNGRSRLIILPKSK